MKLRTLFEMDDSLRKMEREQLDSGSEEEYIHRKLRSIDGWRRELYDIIEQTENDPISASILPQRLVIIPIDDRIRLLGKVMQRIIPGNLDVKPLVQMVIDEDFRGLSRAISNIASNYADTTSNTELEQYWHDWDDPISYFLDLWVRILAHQATSHPWLPGRAQDLISSLYYGNGGNKGLRPILMDALKSMVFE